MSTLRHIGALVAAVTFLALIPAAAIGSPGDVDTPYDGHDTVTATAQPYASTAPFVATLSYNSAAFTTTATERDDNGTSDGIFTNMTGCGASPPYWGGRSGWVRFDTAVSGTLRIDVSTGGYDPFVVLWEAPIAPLGTTQFANLANKDCNAVRADSQEALTYAVAPGRAYHVETLGFCGRGSYWTSAPGCSPGDLDSNSPGGSTSVTLRFECVNGDGDGACDSVDPCPSVVGAQDGCPDRDRDGFLDDADRCPDIAGTDSGCPADQDGDGIANASDACPTEKGYAPSGCPDADGDNVFFPSDDCPDVAGTARDGCVDGDGDGVSDRVDRCPAVYGRSASGCLRVLGASIRWDFVPGTFRLQRLRVQTPTGSKISVTCSAARRASCPFTKKTSITRTRVRNFQYLFGTRSLRGRHLTLTFRVTKRGYLGTYKRYVYRGAGNPRTLERCILQNNALKKCPA